MKPTPPPFLQIDYQITGRCNAKCRFCRCWENKYDSNQDLPAAVWLNTTKKLKNFTRIDLVCIAGGEPLLYRDLFPLIKGLSNEGIHTVVVTNGALLSSENCHRLVESGVGHIDFSMDAFEETHDRLRGVPGLFSKCVDAIAKLKSLRPDISMGVSTLICEENLNQIVDFAEWVMVELPVDAINFQAYNQVTRYMGKNWWRQDPLWPKDHQQIQEILGYLKKRSETGARIANDPRQFTKFKEYFLNPDKGLNIMCPAGTLNFSCSFRGEIVGCIAEAPVGSILRDDPVEVYQNRFQPIREKASHCKENCHFLVNCYFPLRWQEWEKICATEPEAIPAAEWKPGKHILPPEVIEITKKALPRYDSLIRYEDHAHLDSIGKGDQSAPRQHPPGAAKDKQVVYLCGDTSEVHRWGADLDEEDFFKQIEVLTKKNPEKGLYPVVIGVHRTNFFCLERIIAFVLKKRQQSLLRLPEFDMCPLHNLRERFFRHLNNLKEATRTIGISFMVIDPQLEPLFQTVESCIRQNPERENDILRALGPVCKDVFIGPKYLLLDLSGRCNLNCTYCRRFSPWNEAYREGRPSAFWDFLNLEAIENVLCEARDMGTETVLLVGGGEPTLHPHFGAIVARVRDLGMTFNISTNGALIHKYTDQLLDPCCGALTVSISAATDRSFEAIRPGSPPRMLRRIEKNVKQLSQLKKQRGQTNPTIITLYALCRPNVHEILKMAIHSKRMGSDTIWYQMVHLESFSRENLSIPPSDLAKVKRQLRLAKILSKILRLKFHSFIDFEMNHFDGDKGDWSKEGLLHQGCYVGWHFAFVHILQEVFMCCGSKVVGFLNASGRGFKSLWHSDAYRRYRNDGLIMHKENPITLYGSPLYDRYCDSCDNHDQNNMMIQYLRQLNLMQFVQR